tara:strand:+ start:715 stop:897 length:183 start_codon:yes stop_codon:yes gene_type:complete
MKLKSWKTTLTGVVLIAGILISTYWPEQTEVVTKITGVLVGLGFIAARDNNVSSVTAGAK